MTANGLRLWLERLRLRKKEAAEKLGISRPTLDNYLNGKSPVPKHIALACAAIQSGIKEAE